MDLWELCLLPTCPTSNTQSRAPLGAFSVSLCHWVGCAFRAHSEHPGDFTGVCTASAEWRGVSSSCFLQLSMSLCLPEREGAQEWEEMHRGELWLTSLCCLIKAMSRTARGVKRKPISDQQCQAQEQAGSLAVSFRRNCQTQNPLTGSCVRREACLSRDSFCGGPPAVLSSPEDR